MNDVTGLDIVGLLSEAGIGIWTWDPGNDVVYWDDTTHAIYGLKPGAFDGSFEAYAALIHPDDVATVTELIMSLAARGGHYSTKHRVVQPSGTVRWIEGQGRIISENGEPVAGFGVVYDVTDRATIEDERDRLRDSERAARAARTATERDLAYLIEASDGLTGSLNVDRIADRLATFIVPGLADRCVIDILVDDLEQTTLTVHCGGSGKPEAVRRLPDSATASRMSLPMGTVPTDRLVALLPTMPDDADRSSLASGLAVPLVARGRRIGTALAERHDGQWTARAEALLTAITRRAALALENAYLFEAQTKVTNLLVGSVQPHHPPRNDDLEIATHYQAAADVTRLGGDFYDVITLHASEWMVVVGDVAGKGIVAAAKAGLIRSAVWASALTAQDPAAVVRIVNHLLMSDADRPMATLLVAKLTLGPSGLDYEVVSAGHPPPAVVNADGSADLLEAQGTLLGFAERLDLTCAKGTLGPDQTLVLYSDGLIEARLGDAQFGLERFEAAIQPVAELGATAIVRALATAVDGWTAGTPQDDVTLVAVSPR